MLILEQLELINNMTKFMVIEESRKIKLGLTKKKTIANKAYHVISANAEDARYTPHVMSKQNEKCRANIKFIFPD